MVKVHLFNNRPVGGPSIILSLPARSNVEIPAEGDPENKGELIEDAKGVVVEADVDRLNKQAKSIRGLVVKKA